MTSKGGRYHDHSDPPLYAKFFMFDKRGKVINRPGFTNAKILATIGGEPTYRRVSATHQAAANQNIDRRLDRDAEKADSEGNFDPKNTKDGRDKTVRAINLRRGQLLFRKQVLEAYGGRCAVTNCDCPDALEAAHISPYRGDHTNHIQNGILLRSDIHRKDRFFS